MTDTPPQFPLLFSPVVELNQNFFFHRFELVYFAWTFLVMNDIDFDS